LGEGTLTRKTTLWLRRWIIADVPADIAACEFNCKIVSCPNEKFDHCQRRLALEKKIKKQESKIGVSFLKQKISPTLRRKKPISSGAIRLKSVEKKRKHKKITSGYK
jgi:hypothetical protein